MCSIEIQNKNEWLFISNSEKYSHSYNEQKNKYFPRKKHANETS